MSNEYGSYDIQDGKIWDANANQYVTPNTMGLDPSLFSYGVNKGFGDRGSATSSADQYTTTYNGPGGTFTRLGTGGWSSGGNGPMISDLPGYLRMKGQQQSGADFSGYQNQLKNLLSNPSSITQTPGYQFALDQGNQAINRSAAAKGMLNSGNVLAELSKYGQGMASQGYQQQLNNLQSLMQGAQNFGLSSGYYNPSQYTPSFGISGGGGGGGGGRVGTSTSGQLTTNYNGPDPFAEMAKDPYFAPTNNSYEARYNLNPSDPLSYQSRYGIA